MSTKLNWEGIYPAVLTPFTKDGEIDFDMFAKNTEAQIKAGVHGIILAGTLGEASALETEEKFELLKFAKAITDGRIPVILNLSENTTRSAVNYAKKAKELGADGLMLLPPMRYKADNREVVEYFKAVASATDLPILIYNNPVDYGIHVTLDMFEELINYPTIQAVKESTRDLANVTRMINRFGKRIKILGGVDTICLETLMLGADGLVAGLVDAFPNETMAMYNYVKAGEYDKAVAVYRWFMPLLELDIHPKLIQYIKLAASAEGIGNPYVRAPRLELHGEEADRINKIITDGIANRPVLG
ncbi:dihydrodipicolinate synthase family protein [Elizabethkingia anophelis]|uniref:Dihydrodipicolinate synthase family protein n=1 Tax=Elizabethkingia anophelis TaxID=1117645 RepID=A0A494JA20_9FLAO|nr:dihydrodipicolinate synthase family protein [Elizabethkingia anophelis]AQX51695.1 dihydrodipicolinate synthase family protein [Elizabethkingia anophelis]EJC8060890.1 dihydrodipicolinate synthase family protein [Elizabethkingia anophelis]ELB0067040.1 dihydrodipicolinate synthase family protein [Elizabethkingia anophelis]ELB1891734.1 dihydrodipicolinate synthase family protein [Elizabethkingia anophelis]MCL1640830.1 dihydrodipicolinate synthase family protein [Elizabethkingia anophelis]